MKPEFEKICDDIYRLCIPFDGNIYTSVFALFCEQGCIIVDSGTYESDALNYDIPAINKMNINPDWFVCTHLHGDHYGGLETLIKHYPKANVGGFLKTCFGNQKVTQTFEDGQELFCRFKMLNLKGHSDDGLAIFDKKTETLITGDCLQQYGITRFGTSISDFNEYFNTIERVRKLNPKTVICSHDYEPFGYEVCGTAKIGDMLSVCESSARDILKFINENKGMDENKLADIYNEKRPLLPTISPYTVICGKNQLTAIQQSEQIVL